jgi:hypothetical protein
MEGHPMTLASHPVLVRVLCVYRPTDCDLDGAAATISRIHLFHDLHAYRRGAKLSLDQLYSVIRAMSLGSPCSPNVPIIETAYTDVRRGNIGEEHGAVIDDEDYAKLQQDICSDINDELPLLEQVVLVTADLKLFDIIDEILPIHIRLLGILTAWSNMPSTDTTRASSRGISCIPSEEPTSRFVVRELTWGSAAQNSADSSA